jgi:hypothetical protein
MKLFPLIKIEDAGNRKTLWDEYFMSSVIGLLSSGDYDGNIQYIISESKHIADATLKARGE